MCIRDSPGSYFRDRAIVKSQIYSFFFPGNAPHCFWEKHPVKAVSYTHLDVYKRQVPTMFAATAYKLLKLFLEPNGSQILLDNMWTLIIGNIVAFIVALFCLLYTSFGRRNPRCLYRTRTDV